LKFSSFSGWLFANKSSNKVHEADSTFFSSHLLSACCRRKQKPQWLSAPLYDQGFFFPQICGCEGLAQISQNLAIFFPKNLQNFLLPQGENSLKVFFAAYDNFKPATKFK
jgi:hypothetical protein